MFRRLNHVSVGIAAAKSNFWVPPLDLGCASTMITIGVSDDQPGQVFLS
jgi:hypothetical protein